MVITSSQTDIVNQALAELGSTTRINSINDTQRESARRAKTLWPMLLRPLLEDHPWNFALKRAALNKHVAAPEYEWEYQYQLPPLCVRWLPPDRSDPEYFEGEQEGHFLLTDAEAPLKIRYISYVDDTDKWPGLFAQVMVYRLAAAMAEGVSASKGTKDRMEEKANYFLRKAKRADGLATGKRKFGRATVRSDILAARNRRYYHGRR